VNEIIKLAEQLGKAIAQSSQAASLRSTREEMDKQPELKQLLKDYNDHAQKLAQLEHDNKPVEVDDKHKLQDIQTKLYASEVFKKFTSAQVEYVDLMRKVNQSLQSELTETEK